MIDWAIIREKKERKRKKEERREKVPSSLTSRPLVIRELFAHMRMYADD
jgi:hypothetical protein